MRDIVCTVSRFGATCVGLAPHGHRGCRFPAGMAGHAGESESQLTRLTPRSRLEAQWTWGQEPLSATSPSGSCQRGDHHPGEALSYDQGGANGATGYWRHPQRPCHQRAIHTALTGPERTILDNATATSTCFRAYFRWFAGNLLATGAVAGFQGGVCAGGRDRFRTCGLCRVKGARTPRAPTRPLAFHHDIAAQRLRRTGATQCRV